MQRYLFLALLLTNSSVGAVEQFTVEEAVARALKKSPRMEASTSTMAAAEAKRKAFRGKFGPVLQFEGRAMYFNEPPTIGGEAGMSAEDMAITRTASGNSTSRLAELIYMTEPWGRVQASELLT